MKTKNENEDLYIVKYEQLEHRTYEWEYSNDDSKQAPAQAYVCLT